MSTCTAPATQKSRFLNRSRQSRSPWAWEKHHGGGGNKDAVLVQGRVFRTCSRSRIPYHPTDTTLTAGPMSPWRLEDRYGKGSYGDVSVDAPPEHEYHDLWCYHQIDLLRVVHQIRCGISTLEQAAERSGRVLAIPIPAVNSITTQTALSPPSKPAVNSATAQTAQQLPTTTPPPTHSQHLRHVPMQRSPL